MEKVDEVDNGVGVGFTIKPIDEYSEDDYDVVDSIEIVKNSNGSETDHSSSGACSGKMEEITFMNGKKLQLDLGPSSQLDEDANNCINTFILIFFE